MDQKQMSKLKKAANPAPKKTKADTLTITRKDEKSREQLLSEVALSPILGNTITAIAFAKGTLGELDLIVTNSVMIKEVKKVQGGNLSGVEATLMAQAITLDKIFNEMARRAALNVGEHLQAMETYMKLALKAQTQCRTTLQTLAEVKNPQTVSFVKQANISHGPQQVNNSISPRAENFNNQSNELLDVNNGKWLGTGTTGATSGADQNLETVAAVNRTKDWVGQGRQFHQLYQARYAFPRMVGADAIA